MTLGTGLSAVWKQRVIWGVILFALVVTAPTWLFLGFVFASAIGEFVWTEICWRPFNAEAWAKAGESSYTRMCMANDLLWRGRLRGLTRIQVEEMLGPSEGSFEGYDVGYRLSPFGWDFLWLALKYENEKVIKAAIKST